MYFCTFRFLCFCISAFSFLSGFWWGIMKRPVNKPYFQGAEWLGYWEQPLVAIREYDKKKHFMFVFSIFSSIIKENKKKKSLTFCFNSCLIKCCFSVEQLRMGGLNPLKKNHQRKNVRKNEKINMKPWGLRGGGGGSLVVDHKHKYLLLVFFQIIKNFWSFYIYLQGETLLWVRQAKWIFLGFKRLDYSFLYIYGILPMKIILGKPLI